MINTTNVSSGVQKQNLWPFTVQETGLPDVRQRSDEGLERCMHAKWVRKQRLWGNGIIWGSTCSRFVSWVAMCGGQVNVMCLRA